MNQPVPRASTTFFAFSHAKHFFFLTSWKYQQLPILKSLNLENFNPLMPGGNKKVAHT